MPVKGTKAHAYFSLILVVKVFSFKGNGTDSQGHFLQQITKMVVITKMQSSWNTNIIL